MTMEIYAKPGTKVVYSNPTNGYKSDQELADKHLQPGGIYTVSGTEIHSWYTDVYLEEAPGHAFNSVMFNDIDEDDDGD